MQSRGKPFSPVRSGLEVHYYAEDGFGGEAVEMGSTSLMQSSENSTGRRPGAGPGASSPESGGLSGLETVQL